MTYIIILSFLFNFLDSVAQLVKDSMIVKAYNFIKITCEIIAETIVIFSILSTSELKFHLIVPDMHLNCF